jgi:hypothetical protein
MRVCELDSSDSGRGPVVSFCSHGKEYLGSIKGGRHLLSNLATISLSNTLFHEANQLVNRTNIGSLLLGNSQRANELAR